MKKLHKFILKSFLGPLFFTFLISMFVLLMQFLFRYIDELVGKGLEWHIILEFVLYVSATLVPMALPLAVLLASIMTFGNLGEHYELTAIKSAGVSLNRLMRPLIVLVLIISLGALYFSNKVLPVASLKLTTLLLDIKKQNPEVILKEGIFTNDMKDFSIKVNTIDKKTGILRNLLIYDHRDKLYNNKVIVADSGIMNTSEDKMYMFLTLYSGSSYEEVTTKYHKRKNYPFKRIDFTEYKSVINLPGPNMKRTDESVYAGRSYRMFTMNELQVEEDSLYKQYYNKQRLFARTILNQRLFNKENRRYRTDSTRQKSLLRDTLSHDSIFVNANIQKQLICASSALALSRKTKESIRRKKEELFNSKRWINKYTNEWHRKLTLPFACFIFFFIGAPLGAIIRKGGLGLPVIISVVFFIFYYIISTSGERSAKEGAISSVVGMWLSTGIILPFGIILTYKATRDSALFNIDIYYNLLKKINPFNIIKRWKK